MKKLLLILLGSLGTSLIAMDAPSLKKQKTDFTLDVGTRFTPASLQEITIRSKITDIFNITNANQLKEAIKNFKEEIQALTPATKELAIKEFNIAKSQRLFSLWSRPGIDRTEKSNHLNTLLQQVRQFNTQHRDSRLNTLESKIQRIIRDLNRQRR